MNNISFSKKMLTNSMDTGERLLHWVGINKRLPTEDGRYLITFKQTRRVTLVEFNNGVFSPHQESILNYNSDISAWMKLPEPYKTT